MASTKLMLILLLCLVNLARSAPRQRVESSSSNEALSEHPSVGKPTSRSPIGDSGQPIVGQPAASNQDDHQRAANSTCFDKTDGSYAGEKHGCRVYDSSPTNKQEPANTTELPEVMSTNDISTFTCRGKINGYYADVKLGCRVYHFCTKVDGIGEDVTYQRVSYMCLEGSRFDQYDLNCVHEKELKVPCDRAEEEYEKSNKQFDSKETPPSISDSLTASLMMNPITRFIAG